MPGISIQPTTSALTSCSGDRSMPVAASSLASVPGASSAEEVVADGAGDGSTASDTQMSSPRQNFFDYGVHAHVHLPAVCRMDTDIKITEQKPVLQGRFRSLAQAGEVGNQKNVNISIRCLILKLHQARPVVETYSTGYIAGSANDFKALLFCAVSNSALSGPLSARRQYIQALFCSITLPPCYD